MQNFGEREEEGEPCMTTACYYRQLDRVIGPDQWRQFRFPAPLHMEPGLGHAEPNQLAEVEVLGLGYGLYWEFDVRGLVYPRPDGGVSAPPTPILGARIGSLPDR